MLRRLIARMLWLGRLASAVFGLVLVLGLALGAGTAALAAVPGDPLKLGTINAINRLTVLSGAAATALLKLDNDGAGPALALEVDPGRAPMSVSAGAGKVANLDADKLDGKHAAAFLGANQKAVDAARLGGIVPTQFMGRRFARVAADGTLLGGNGVTGAVKGANDRYTVTFDGDVSACGMVATLNGGYDDSGIIVADPLSGAGAQVSVYILRNEEDPFPFPFTLMILC